ncbi:DEAD/DEAH box helicase, partial [Rhizobiaceae sp. 2RAB30]
GFIPDIERICKLIPFTRQTLFFSATMPPEITKLTEQFLHAPVRVEVAKAATTAETVTQRLVKSGPKPWDKREVLRNLIRAEEDGLKNAIIFCNRKVEVSELFRSLVKYDFNAGALHGDMDQRARMTMLANFRDGKLKLLVASDVAARGLDIPDVSHVFNFDVPIHAEDYVHRIGRTGRAGRSGKSFTIATRSDVKYVDAIERLIGKNIDWLDGDLSTVVVNESDDEGPRRGRSASRRGGRKDEGERSPRGERRPRGEKRAPVDPTTVEQPEVVPHEAVEERRARKEAIRSDNADRRGKPEHRRDDRPRRHRDDADVNSVVGFGDDMPAFMKVAVKL